MAKKSSGNAKNEDRKGKKGNICHRENRKPGKKSVSASKAVRVGPDR